MNKRGNTIIEVVVSFVIISIISFSLISVYTSSKKINKHQMLRENMINQVDNIFTTFQANPSEFSFNLGNNKIYPYVESMGNKVYQIYFDNRFTSSLNYNVEGFNKNNYIIVKVNDIYTYTYTLTLEVMMNNEFYKAYERTVKDGTLG